MSRQQKRPREPIEQAEDPAVFNAMQKTAIKETQQHNSGNHFRLLLLTTGSLMLLFALKIFVGNWLESGVGFGCGDISPAALLYRIRKQRSGKSTYEHLTSLHPVLTQVLSPSALKKIVSDKHMLERRTRERIVKNSLVAACADISEIKASVLASWTRVYGIREIVFVDYSNARRKSQKSLRLVNSVNRLGKIIHVTAQVHNSSQQTSGSLSRAQALNLGIGISSGVNTLLVSCRAILSSSFLSDLRLSNSAFYAGKSTVDSMKNYEVIYTKKHALENIHGFDERIDIPGSEFADLVDRLSKFALRRLSVDIATIQRNTEIMDEKVLFGHDLSAFQAEDVIERAKKAPFLSRCISAAAIKELPNWNGSSTSSQDDPFGIHAFQYRALREQVQTIRQCLQRNATFQISGDVSNSLWIHASRKRRKATSMLSFLSPYSLTKVLLGAHRQFLHDHYKICDQVLNFVEQVPVSKSSTNASLSVDDDDLLRLKVKMENYTPLLFEVMWRQKQLLVVNLDVGDPIHLFIGASWAIASAITMNRALILAGNFLHTPVSYLLNFEDIADLMHREHNLHIQLIGGQGRLECNRGSSGGCWTRDVSAEYWEEFNLTGEPSPLQPNVTQHVLFNIVSGTVVAWDHDARTTLSYRQLQEKAFSSISLSSEVGRRISNMSQAIHDNIGETTALWLTNMPKETKRSVEHYMEHHASHEGYRTQMFVTGNKATSIEAAIESVPEAEKSAGSQDAYHRMADAWIALQCRNIVFDSIEPPLAWVGADNAILEWRRIHAPDSPHHGLFHVRSSSNVVASQFHKLEFYEESSTESSHEFSILQR